MKHTLCVVTGSRAEFGILLPLLRRLQDCPEIELRLAVTGSHLSAAYGHTVDEIKDSGLPISVQLPLPLEENCGKVGMAKATAAAMDAFAEYFSQHRPELLPPPCWASLLPIFTAVRQQRARWMNFSAIPSQR